MKSKIGIILAGLYLLIAASITIYGFNCGGEFCGFISLLPVFPEVPLLGVATANSSFFITVDILLIIFNGGILYLLGLAISKAISSKNFKKMNNKYVWILNFALLGALTGAAALGLLLLNPATLIFGPGVTFGIFSAYTLAKSGNTQFYKFIIVFLASVLGYMAAYFLAVFTLSMDVSYLAYMAFSAIAGGLILGLGYLVVKLILNLKYLSILVLFSLLASLITPEHVGTLLGGPVTGGPNIFVLFPLWQGLVGAYVGFLAYQKTQISAPANNVKPTNGI